MDTRSPSRPTDRPALAPEIAALRGDRLEGIKHPAVALARRLKGEAGRAAAGLYVVHGPVLLERALAAGAGVVLALYTPRLPADPAGAALLTRLRAVGLPHALIGEGIMRAIVERAYAPEVVALLPRRTLRPADLAVGAGTLWLLGDTLTNPSNLGMLVRTAYGAGAEALLLTAGTADPFVWQVSTGSTGALFRLPLVEGVGAGDLRRWREAGLLTLAAAPRADRDYTEVDYRRPLCLMVGSEASGLTPEIMASADLRVRIPMAHHLDSLNVAVAAGILLFEARRQRGPRDEAMGG